jgi:hypothetical protein
MFLWILFCGFLLLLVRAFQLGLIIHEAHPELFRNVVFLILSPAIILYLALRSLWKISAQVIREKKAPWTLAAEAQRRREEEAAEARKAEARRKEEDERHYREYLRRGKKY